MHDSLAAAARKGAAAADCRVAAGPAMSGPGRVRGYAELTADLAALGLRARGGFHAEAAEAIAADRGGPAATLVLVGAVGDSHWPAFAASPERHDGRPDPLDRWSRRLLGGVAEAWGATALFPFAGPPFPPFQRWALRAEPVAASPLGLLVHPRYGLWHSYRGALAFPDRLPGLPAREAAPHPCAGCAERPCLTACPVGAFSAPPREPDHDSGGAGHYDTARCGAHLAGPEGEACLAAACLARAACPLGAGYRYGPAAARFHLGAFKAALEGRRPERTAER